MFNFYFIFYYLSLFSQVCVKIFKKSKRKFIVLRAPFHFKLSKHHLMYSYYNINCCVIVKNEYSDLIKPIFTEYMLQNRIVRYSFKKPYLLKMSNLLLYC